MPKNAETPPSTDDFLQEALKSTDTDHLLELERKIVERMLPNQTSLHERVETVFAAIDRRLNTFQAQQSTELSKQIGQNSNNINRVIAGATMICVIAGIVFGVFQIQNAYQQTNIQKSQLEAEYRPTHRNARNTYLTYSREKKNLRIST